MKGSTAFLVIGIIIVGFILAIAVMQGQVNDITITTNLTNPYGVLIPQANISDGITLPFANISEGVGLPQANITDGITIPANNITGGTFPNQYNFTDNITLTHYIILTAGEKVCLTSNCDQWIVSNDTHIIINNSAGV